MIRVARNLRKKKFSVRKKTVNGWKVWKYVDDIHLADVKFIISEAGRQRVLRDREKNVHAFAEGRPIQLKGEYNREITYNPYVAGYFYWKDTGDRVDTMKSAVLRKGKIYGLGLDLPAQV